MGSVGACVKPPWLRLASSRTARRSDLLAVAWLERGESTSNPNQECSPRSPSLRPEGNTSMAIMIGIDPHKATHTAVAIDSDERMLDEFTVRASKAQTTRLRTWASQFNDPAWAVESARGLGEGALRLVCCRTRRDSGPAPGTERLSGVLNLACHRGPLPAGSALHRGRLPRRAGLAASRNPPGALLPQR